MFFTFSVGFSTVASLVALLTLTSGKFFSKLAINFEPPQCFLILLKATSTLFKLSWKSDAIFIEELIKANLYDQVSQAFCAYLPVKSVGVVGDERRYADVIAIRAVETVDFMTATWAKLPYDFLGHVSNRIVNELEEVSRVVYDISSKPPATIEWE